MKKLVALLLCVLLTVGCVPALAQYDEEITIMGIPWGETTVEDFYQALVDCGSFKAKDVNAFINRCDAGTDWLVLFYLPADLSVITDGASWRGAYLDDDYAVNPLHSAIAKDYLVEGDDIPGFTVGGYQPLYVEFFLFHGFEDGIINPDKKEFLSAQMEFLDAECAEEMVQVLNDQYGPCDFECIGADESALRIWYGANGTAVALETEGNVVRELFYTHTDLGTRIPQMHAAAENGQ